VSTLNSHEELPSLTSPPRDTSFFVLKARSTTIAAPRDDGNSELRIANRGRAPATAMATFFPALQRQKLLLLCRPDFNHGPDHAHSPEPQTSPDFASTVCFLNSCDSQNAISAVVAGRSGIVIHADFFRYLLRHTHQQLNPVRTVECGEGQFESGQQFVRRPRQVRQQYWSRVRLVNQIAIVVCAKRG
jgi:hypothetical protein